MKNIINLKIKNELANILVLGFLLIITGIILTIQSFYIGIALFILGILIVTFKKGIKLIPEKHTIKFYRKFFFIEFGNEKKLKEIQYVAIIRVTLKQTMNVLSITSTDVDQKLRLNLIFDDNKILQLITDKKSKIFPAAQEIAKSFNVDIYDNSENEKKWIRMKT